MFAENRPFPLSLSQQNILSLERAFPGTSMNAIGATVTIHGRVEIEALSHALGLILRADASLRTQLTEEDGEVLQVHVPYEETHFPVFDFTASGADGFTHWEDAVTREPMPLYNSPLCRFYLFRTGEEAGGVLAVSHHIISDGWSQLLLCNRIAETYIALIKGETPTLSPSPDYESHVAAERDYLTSPAYARDIDYWARLLETPSEPVSFKTRPGASVSPVGRRRSYVLPEVLNHALYSFCKTHRVSPFAPYFMALVIAARRMGGGQRLVVGTPIHNRTDVTARDTTGMFVSTLPLLTELNEDWTALEFNDRLQESWYDLLRHQRCPFERIEALPRRGAGRLFDVAFSYQDNLSYKSDDATVRFSGRWNYSGYQAEQLLIHMTNLEDNRRYTVDYDYLAQLFSGEDIDRLHSVICSILDQIMTRPNRPIREVSILSALEREQVLYRFNSTARPLAHDGLWESFSRFAAENPGRAALIDGGRRTTYGEALRLANAAAFNLAPRLTQDEPLIALLLPRGAELSVAMLGIMAAGAAFLLLSPDYPAKRIEEIVKSAGCELLITSEALRPDIDGPPVITTDELFALGGVADPPERAPDKLCYVVYTSGSAGRPKGVEITRRNLKNFAAAMRDIFPRGAMLSISNVSFDAFILECTVSLLNGLTVVFASDRESESPAALAALMKGYGVDYMCLTPSRLEAYLTDSAFRAALSGRKGVLCGGEAFSGRLLSDLKRLAPISIYNQYGPSETTVGVSVADLRHCSAISAGAPMPNCRLYVLDSRLQPLPAGVYGDLYIGGECVGRGYRNEPELTAASFMDDPFVYGGRMYRSGDVARFTPAGEIQLRGRSDRQVKLRGQRVEPEEISRTLAAHPAVERTAAKVVEHCGQATLYAYYTCKAPVSDSSLMQWLSQRLPLYMLPSKLMRLDALPMTASGKLDENALPVPAAPVGGGEPSTKAEADILAVFRAVLKNPELGADDDYFSNGGNSLNAMEALSLLEPILGRRLRISEFYAGRTARAMAAVQNESGAGDTVPAVVKSGERGFYPPTEIQKDIYFQCALTPGTAYNMPGVFRLGSQPDAARLEAALRELIAGDEIFRSYFTFDKGELVAHVAQTVDFKLARLEGETLPGVWRGFVRSFNLAEAPLVRAGLWESAGAHYLFVDMHHIIGDGVTTPLVISRLDRLYRGESVPAQGITFIDYAHHVAKSGSQGVEEWAQRLSPVPAPLDLPADFTRERGFDFKGAGFEFTLPDSVARLCRDYCRDNKLTPFMLFAAAWGLLLSRVSGKNELIIGTPAAGRAESGLWSVCGPFIETLPLRIDAGEGSTAEYLSRVREETLYLLEHESFPADEVMRKLKLPRKLGENPLYQTLFSYRPLDTAKLTFAGEPLESVSLPRRTAKFDLSLEAAESGESFAFNIEYASSLFEHKTAVFYSRCFMATVCALISARAARLCDIDPLMPDDRYRLLDLPRETVVPFRNVSIDALISERALREPNAPAVVFHGETVTFAELQSRAEGLAAALQGAGVTAGARVGLCCRRSPQLIAGILAVLKCGAAYVPFLPDYPSARVKAMLTAAQACLVLCDEAGRAAVPEGIAALSLSADGGQLTPPAMRGEDMYVLFTSGSTGEPKGVVVGHRAAANYADAIRKILAHGSGAVLCTANMTFDIFQTEALLPLTLGKSVVLADEEERALPWKTAQLIRTQNVKTVQLTPSQMSLALGNEEFCEAVALPELIILTGEASDEKLVSRLSQYTKASLVNLYGPTEATVYCSAAALEAGSRVTIGTPLQNCRLYIMDENLNEVIPTARGELYIAGECLSRGYAGDAAKTAERFLPDPFFPGERMYRSGDFARLRADGRTECLGRVDSQLKINGLRIEPQEIISAAVGTGLVSKAAVIAVRKEGVLPYLHLFAVPEAARNGLRNDLFGRLKAALPPYMIPAQVTFVDEFPVNASGKTDLKVLEELCDIPSACNCESEKSAADRLEEIWAETLGREKLDRGASFFEQGGTSLSALGVLTQYYSEGLSMTLAEFYDNPTLDAQARLLGLEGAAPEKAAPRGESLPLMPAPEGAPAMKSLPAKNVLVTGATGFLGAHLVYELLEQNAAKNVLCLMRDGDEERLHAALEYYFGADWVNKNAPRIAAELGDIEKEHFGLGTAAYNALLRAADCVFHAAADVRHYVSAGDSCRVNAEGTRNTAMFALAAGIPFNHMSTVSIAGEYFPDEPERTARFTERDFYFGQNWDDNIYVKGKLLAEKAVYELTENGLCARVFRLGRLVGRERDGLFQRRRESNALYLTLRSAADVGALPQAAAEAEIDLTPVDFAARAIIALSVGDNPVYHIVSPNTVTLERAVRALCPTLEILSESDFSERLAEISRSGRGAQAASLIELWNRLKAAGPARIEADWNFTADKLKQLGIEMPTAPPELLLAQYSHRQEVSTT